MSVKLKVISSLVIFALQGCGGGDGVNSTIVAKLPATASFTAWVGESDSEITFDEALEGVEFYRFRDKNCDLNNYISCSKGQLDFLDGSTVVDSASNLSEAAYFRLKKDTEVSSTTRFSTVELKSRYSHQSVVFNDKIWVIGGNDGSFNRTNDVWSSENGTTWVEEAPSAGFSVRSSHQAVVFNNKLWVIGGYDGSYTNDVWSSTDGITWVEETSNAGFAGRSGHQSVMFNDKLWLIGGYKDSGHRTNDIWSSVDGVTWAEETSNAGFSARRDHQSIVFNSKLWVIGGTADSGLLNDIWTSTDGVVWTDDSSSARFSARSSHQSTIFNNKLWVIGGSAYGGELNDAWSSSDGIT